MDQTVLQFLLISYSLKLGPSENRMARKKRMLIYRLIFRCSAHMINSCRSLPASKRNVCVLPIFRERLISPSLFNLSTAFCTVLYVNPVDSANIGMLCSMFPTYSAWSNTLAVGPPKTIVSGPSTNPFNSNSLPCSKRLIQRDCIKALCSFPKRVE